MLTGNTSNVDIHWVTTVSALEEKTCREKSPHQINSSRVPGTFLCLPLPSEDQPRNEMKTNANSISFESTTYRAEVSRHPKML